MARSHLHELINLLYYSGLLLLSIAVTGFFSQSGSRFSRPGHITLVNELMQPTLCSCIIWRHLHQPGKGPSSSSCFFLTHICLTKAVSLTVISSWVLLAPQSSGPFGCQHCILGLGCKLFHEMPPDSKPRKEVRGDAVDIRTSRCQGQPPTHQKLTGKKRRTAGVSAAPGPE